jgi:hypothetical protein
VKLPLAPGTRFVISQGAFGRDTHNQKGIEYRWDFDVPYATPVLAVEGGTVPLKGTGSSNACDG